MDRPAENPAPRNPEIVQQIAAQSPSGHARTLFVQAEWTRKAQSRPSGLEPPSRQHSGGRLRKRSGPRPVIAIPFVLFGAEKGD